MAKHWIIVQCWEESERGWGVRPDGYSIHLTQKDRDKFVREYLNNQQDFFNKLGINGVPDEYTRVSGEPYTATVDDEAYEDLKKSECGVMIYNNKYPQRLGSKNGFN